jgi:hypothetical protein
VQTRHRARQFRLGQHDRHVAARRRLRDELEGHAAERTDDAGERAGVGVQIVAHNTEEGETILRDDVGEV